MRWWLSKRQREPRPAYGSYRILERGDGSALIQQYGSVIMVGSLWLDAVVAANVAEAESWISRRVACQSQESRLVANFDPYGNRL